MCQTYPTALSLLSNIVTVGPVVLDSPGLVHGQDTVGNAQLVGSLLVEDLELHLVVNLDYVRSQAALLSNVVVLTVQDQAMRPLGAGRTNAAKFTEGKARLANVKNTDLEKMDI